MKKIALLICCFCLHVGLFAQDNGLLLHLDFDDAKEIPLLKSPNDRHLLDDAYTTEKLSGEKFRINGLAKFVPGVKGTAIKFDGFSSYIEGGLEEYPAMGDNISIEAWVSLGAYPWNWAPIITIGRYEITGFYFGIDARGRVGFHVPDRRSVWHECNSEVDPETKLGLELKKWYHVVGTFSTENGLAIYINGQLAATQSGPDKSIVYSELDKGFRLGANREWLAPSDPIRPWATYPSRYALDGIVDEVKMYNKELTAVDVQSLYTKLTVENEPEFASRTFPRVKPSGRFGANYTRLKYYPEWDAIWPVGDHMDVVVQFDEYPTRLMFWRGTRFSACWVSENGKWMADQSRETGYNWYLSEGDRDDMPTGCVEHMSDKQCRSSRVAIIENNDARIVVNWRYLQMDTKFRQKDLENNTGFGQWANELYYIYPDGMCVRHVLPGFGGWQESIFLNEPGTKPEDNVELEACTLYNMDGERKTYSWEHGPPRFDLENANIQLINFKSEYKPFLIHREGARFGVFHGEIRPEYSHFPWWNHWPVAQISSDGRSALAPDRAAHSSISWGFDHGDAAIYGMTNQPEEMLVDLARSWNHPPEILVNSGDYESYGYDYRQRAYVVNTLDQGTQLELIVDATERSPMFNPAFVIENWDGSDIQLKLDDKEIPRGKDFRYAMEYDVEGNISLIVWIKGRADSKTQIELIPAK